MNKSKWVCISSVDWLLLSQNFQKPFARCFLCSIAQSLLTSSYNRFISPTRLLAIRSRPASLLQFALYKTVARCWDNLQQAFGDKNVLQLTLNWSTSRYKLCGTKRNMLCESQGQRGLRPRANIVVETLTLGKLMYICRAMYTAMSAKPCATRQRCFSGGKTGKQCFQNRSWGRDAKKKWFWILW